MNKNVIHGDQLKDGEEWTDHPALDGKWRNYGDANPDIHGGAWVRFDSDGEYWEVVKTTSGHDLPTGYVAACLKMEESDVTDKTLDNTQMVESIQIYPEEIWTNGKPPREGMDENGEIVYGWSDDLQREMEECHTKPDGNLDIGFIESAMAWGILGYYGTYHLNGVDEVVTGTYPDILANHGVTPDTAADPDYYDFW